LNTLQMHVTLSSLCTFEVGGYVHRRSWGKRSLFDRVPRKRKHKNSTRRAAAVSASEASSSSTLTSTSSESPLRLWSADHFDVEKELGRGHFGRVYRATYREHTDDEEDDAASSESVVVGSGDDDGKENVVALKTFCKRDVMYQVKHGGRSLELLQREINIHSWYVPPVFG